MRLSMTKFGNQDHVSVLRCWQSLANSLPSSSVWCSKSQQLTAVIKLEERDVATELEQFFDMVNLDSSLRRLGPDSELSFTTFEWKETTKIKPGFSHLLPISEIEWGRGQKLNIERLHLGSRLENNLVRVSTCTRKEIQQEELSYSREAVENEDFPRFPSAFQERTPRGSGTSVYDCCEQKKYDYNSQIEKYKSGNWTYLSIPKILHKSHPSFKPIATIILNRLFHDSPGLMSGSTKPW